MAKLLIQCKDVVEDLLLRPESIQSSSFEASSKHQIKAQARWNERKWLPQNFDQTIYFRRNNDGRYDLRSPHQFPLDQDYPLYHVCKLTEQTPPHLETAFTECAWNYIPQHFLKCKEESTKTLLIIDTAYINKGCIAVPRKSTLTFGKNILLIGKIPWHAVKGAIPIKDIAQLYDHTGPVVGNRMRYIRDGITDQIQELFVETRNTFGQPITSEMVQKIISSTF